MTNANLLALWALPVPAQLHLMELHPNGVQVSDMPSFTLALSSSSLPLYEPGSYLRKEASAKSILKQLACSGNETQGILSSKSLDGLWTETWKVQCLWWPPDGDLETVETNAGY